MKKNIILLLLLSVSFVAFSQKINSKVHTDTIYPPAVYNPGPILTSVEIFPEFKGGMDALKSYLAEHVNYPADSREHKTEGKVIVKFVVLEDGSLSDEKIIRGVDSSIDREVIRVVKEMPKWNPGMQNGKAVKVYYNLPISFKLPKEKEASLAELIPDKKEKKDTIPDASDYILAKEPVKEIFEDPDVLPVFPGGMKELMRFLSANFHYPDVAWSKNIQGRVMVQFVIDEKGVVTNPVITKSVGGGCDEESLRIVRAMPTWEPGTKNGKPVKVTYSLPMTFKLGK